MKMINGNGNRFSETNTILDWLWKHENLIDSNMRAESSEVYDFISNNSPMVLAFGNGYYEDRENKEPEKIISAIMGVSPYTLSKINKSGGVTGARIITEQQGRPCIYIMRTVTEISYQGLGMATMVKKAFIEQCKMKRFSAIWGHHELGSTMQHINLRLGAEEIMTEPRGWNGSDKTHILYRITL